MLSSCAKDWPVSCYTEDIYGLYEAIAGKAPHDIRRASGKALCNEVWDVTSGGDNFILRLNKEPAVDIYRKELWCIEAATKADVPSAVPLDCGTHDGTAWMLQTKIEGTVGSEWKGNPLHLWRQIGELSARLHTVAVDGYWDDMNYPGKQAMPARGWNECLRARIEPLFEEELFLRHGVFTPAQNRTAKDKLEELYKLEFSPRLGHLDLTFKNTIVNSSNKASLIDYDGAGGGYGAVSELAAIATFDNAPGVVKAYREGYGISDQQFECMQAPLAQMSLLRAMGHIYYTWKNRPGQQAPFFHQARDKCLECLRHDKADATQEFQSALAGGLESLSDLLNPFRPAVAELRL